jgi:hypothetical protein
MRSAHGKHHHLSISLPSPPSPSPPWLPKRAHRSKEKVSLHLLLPLLPEHQPYDPQFLSMVSAQDGVRIFGSNTDRSYLRTLKGQRTHRNPLRQRAPPHLAARVPLDPHTHRHAEVRGRRTPPPGGAKGAAHHAVRRRRAPRKENATPAKGMEAAAAARRRIQGTGGAGSQRSTRVSPYLCIRSRWTEKDRKKLGGGKRGTGEKEA